MEKKKHYGWIIQWVITVSLAAICYIALYGVFKTQAEAQLSYPYENPETIQMLNQYNQLLYRDFYNQLHDTDLDATELYYSFTEEMKNSEQTLNVTNVLRNYFQSLESRFGDFNLLFDYRIMDTDGTVFLSNVEENRFLNKNYRFLITFVYDENGNLSIRDLNSTNQETMLKYASEYVRSGSNPASDTVLKHIAETEYQQYDLLLNSRRITNCAITYGITDVTAEGLKNGSLVNYNLFPHSYSLYSAYRNADCGEIYMLLTLAVMICGFLIPIFGMPRPWEVYRLFRAPVELLLLFIFYLLDMTSDIIDWVYGICTGERASRLQLAMLSVNGAQLIMIALNFLFLVMLFSIAWYIGVCLKEIRTEGILGYFRKRCFCYQIFPYTKRKWNQFYRELININVTKDTKRTLLKLVVINAVILVLISSFWFVGYFAIVIYSVLLYYLLKKYVGSLQEYYRRLLQATNRIAEGNLNAELKEELGIFEPFRPQISKIQKGFRKAVEEEIRSQRMKGELITNVSHDLKTPLTAIITYIGLLKAADLTEEKRREYLDTLERKSLRLKVLIEDLFEISKASSKSVKLEPVDVDIFSLVKQAQLEVSDKLQEAGLEVRMMLPAEKLLLKLDSQKTYRIYENLFSNIAKYALEGTRVYISAQVTDTAVSIILKNISAQEITVSSDELTERFVRGDASRNTEGSGLGLAIAKSFAELQSGRLILENDGDLFKVTTIWQRTV